MARYRNRSGGGGEVRTRSRISSLHQTNRKGSVKGIPGCGRIECQHLKGRDKLVVLLRCEIVPALPCLDDPVLVLARHEKEMIEAALAECDGRISGPLGAATKLGLPARTLDSKIKRFKISKYRFKVPCAS
jgi:hypothetical protein